MSEYPAGLHSRIRSDRRATCCGMKSASIAEECMQQSATAADALPSHSPAAAAIAPADTKLSAAAFAPCVSSGVARGSQVRCAARTRAPTYWAHSSEAIATGWIGCQCASRAGVSPARRAPRPACSCTWNGGKALHVAPLDIICNVMLMMLMMLPPAFHHPQLPPTAPHEGLWPASRGVPQS